MRTKLGMILGSESGTQCGEHLARVCLMLAVTFVVHSWAVAQPAQPRQPVTTVAAPAPSVDALTAEARDLLERGRAVQALARARQAHQLEPGNYRPLYYVAFALMELGDLSGARRAAQDSLAAAPSEAARVAVLQLQQQLSASAATAEADAALVEGLYAKAGRLYREAFTQGLLPAARQLEAAELHLSRLNDLGTASAMLRDLANRQPGGPGAQRLVALRPQLRQRSRELELRARKAEGASRVSLLESALEADDDNREAHVALAAELAQASDWPVLEESLKRLNRRGWLKPALKGGALRLESAPLRAQARRLFEDIFGLRGATELVGNSEPAVAPERDCDVCPWMVRVPAGSFNMGTPTPERRDEDPQRGVAVRAFSIGRFEVTQAEWRAMMGADPSGFKACDDCPVERVSWTDAQEYLRRLSARSGRTYRLPSEAEWEYAARARTVTAYHVGPVLTALQANIDLKRTMPVGRYPANPFGLHDMHGNVWEWVQDCYMNTYSEAPTDGSAREWRNCEYRVLRGGSWGSQASSARSAVRFRAEPDLREDYAGFRVARTMP